MDLNDKELYSLITTEQTRHKLNVTEYKRYLVFERNTMNDDDEKEILYHYPVIKPIYCDDYIIIPLQNENGAYYWITRSNILDRILNFKIGDRELWDDVLVQITDIISDVGDKSIYYKFKCVHTADSEWIRICTKAVTDTI